MATFCCSTAICVTVKFDGAISTCTHQNLRQRNDDSGFRATHARAFVCDPAEATAVVIFDGVHDLTLHTPLYSERKLPGGANLVAIGTHDALGAIRAPCRYSCTPL